MLEVDRKFDFQHFIYDYINIYDSLQAGSWGYYGRI